MESNRLLILFMQSYTLTPTVQSRRQLACPIAMLVRLPVRARLRGRSGSNDLCSWESHSAASRIEANAAIVASSYPATSPKAYRPS